MANAADTAANFGYSVAFFNSDPELKSLLNTAVKGNWTPAQFVAKLQATRWFKKNGEAARQMYALRTSDPATYNQRLASAHAQVLAAARQMGAPAPGGVLNTLSAHALSLGWTDEQIKAALQPYVKASTNGVYAGTAAQSQMQIRQLASDYGYTVSNSQMGGWIKGMTRGDVTIEHVKQQIMANTMSRYPALKDRLASGETLDQIAAPYKDSYSKTLEVNPETISLNDPLIQKALATKDSKGKPSTQTVWQFEDALRSDPRWLQTNNARDQLVGNTRKVLSDMGLVN